MQTKSHSVCRCTLCDATATGWPATKVDEESRDEIWSSSGWAFIFCTFTTGNDKYVSGVEEVQFWPIVQSNWITVDRIRMQERVKLRGMSAPINTIISCQSVIQLSPTSRRRWWRRRVYRKWTLLMDSKYKSILRCVPTLCSPGICWATCPARVQQYNRDGTIY